MTYDEADRIYRDVTPTTHINLKNYIDCSNEFGLRKPKFGTDLLWFITIEYRWRVPNCDYPKGDIYTD